MPQPPEPPTPHPPEPPKPPERAAQPRSALAVAFTCPCCGRPYGDGLYHGPWPHAPGRLCMDCWADQWAEFEHRIFRDQDWTVLDEALWLICQGFTQSEAADLIGRHRNTLRDWIRQLRKFPHLIPDWLCKSSREKCLASREMSLSKGKP